MAVVEIGPAVPVIDLVDRGLGTLAMLRERASLSGTRENHDRMLFYALDLMDRGVSLKSITNAMHGDGSALTARRLAKARARRARLWEQSGNEPCDDRGGMIFWSPRSIAGPLMCLRIWLAEEFE